MIKNSNTKNKPIYFIEIYKIDPFEKVYEREPAKQHEVKLQPASNIDNKRTAHRTYSLA